MTLSEKTDTIRALEAAGYVLVPLCSPTAPHTHRHGGKDKPCSPRSMGKVPPRYDWGKTRHAQYAPEDLAQGNYGIVLQPGDLIIDIDPRNFKPASDKPYTRLLKTIEVPISSFTVKSGSGGFHVYLKKPESIDIIKALDDYPGIDFLSSGAQLVGPGSVHHLSGQPYVVHAGAPGSIAQAPEALLAILQTTKREAPQAGEGTGRFVDDLQTRTRFADYLREAPASVKGEHGDETAFKVAAHGRDLGLPPVITLELMLEFWNPRNTPQWVPQNLEVKVLNAYRYGKSALGAEHPQADFDVPPGVTLNEAPTVSWVMGKNDAIVKCFRNTLNYFYEQSAGLKGVFAYNEFSVRTEFVQPAPWHRGRRLPLYRGVTDHDLHMLKGFLAQRHRYEVPIKDLESAIANAADSQRFHPVREYLTGLKWDGMQRLDTWLNLYLGAQDEGHPAYLAAAGRKTLCAAVMRALQPGVDFHHVLVLEGAQDVGKSSVVKILGGAWASDAPVDPHSRDTVDALQGRWIVEMAELEVFRKADEDALKAFITRPTDRVRLAYGRATGEYPRQCIFIATKNPGAESTYLKDETGNRRYWPVACSPRVNPKTGLRQVDFDALRENRDQLFAEATYLMTQEKPREPLSMHTPALKAAAKAIAGQRLAKPAWLEAISEWLTRVQSDPATERKFITAREVYRHALQGNDLSYNRIAAFGVAAAMRELGWEKCHGRQEGTLHNGWRPVADKVTPLPAREPAAVIITPGSRPRKNWAGML